MNKDKDFTAMDKDKEIICISSRGGEPGINKHGKDLVSAEQRIRERLRMDQQREMREAAGKKR